MTTESMVSTPVGMARLWINEASHPRLRCVLGHGAGGGPRTADLQVLAERLPQIGVSVVRVEQPWHAAGKHIAPSPAMLDRAWLAVVQTLGQDLPLVVGGRSAGARVACRTATELAAIGVVALAFPLHPPGNPAKSRLDELAAAAELLPVLVMQGEHDSFGRPSEFPAGPYRLVRVRHADHSMKVAKAFDQQEALDTVATTVSEWLDQVMAT